MSAYCRICYEEKGEDEDSYISCNNCGSFACRKHHEWWGRSKNAFCTECFPLELANSVAAAATGLNATSNPRTVVGEELASLIKRAINEHLGDFSTERLSTLLYAIAAEIRRREIQNDQNSG